MKKTIIIVATVVAVVVVILSLGYAVEYDKPVSDSEVISYYKTKNNDAINNLLSHSKITNSYCRKSNKSSVLPYFTVNKWLITELEVDENYQIDNSETGFQSVSQIEDYDFQAMKNELYDLIESKKLLWCKPALSDGIEWNETYSFFDDLSVKLSTLVYCGVDDSTGKVYLVTYQTGE